MISILLTLFVVGAILWLINLAPIDGTIKRIIHGVVILCVIIWLLQLFVPGVTLFPGRLR